MQVVNARRSPENKKKKNPEKNTTTTSTTPLEPIKWRTKAASSAK